MRRTKTLSSYRESLRDKILDASMHAFAKRGIKAVKMDDIAKSLSISKRTLYEVYDNKEILLYEGVKKYYALNEEKMAEEMAKCNNVMDMLLRIYRMKVENYKGISPEFYFDLERYPMVNEFLHHDDDRKHKEFMDFLKRGVSEGYFRDDVDLTLIARLFGAVVDFVTQQQLFIQYSVETLFRSCIFVSLRGFCTLKGIQVLDDFQTNNM